MGPGVNGGKRVCGCVLWYTRREGGETGLGGAERCTHRGLFFAEGGEEEPRRKEKSEVSSARCDSLCFVIPNPTSVVAAPIPFTFPRANFGIGG